MSDAELKDLTERVEANQAETARVISEAQAVRLAALETMTAMLLDIVAEQTKLLRSRA